MLQGLGVLLLAPLLSACYEEQPNTTATTAVVTATVSNAPVAPAAPVAPHAPVVSNAPLAAGVVTNAPATNAVPGGEVVLVKKFDPSTLNLSPGVADIVKMAQSGVAPSVMLEFINKAPHGFSLTADEIVYLTDLGVPEDVIKAMLRKEGSPAVAQPAPAPAATNQAPPQVATPPPAPQAPQAPQAPPAPGQEANQAAAGTTVVQQPVYVTQPQTVVTYQYFYDSLTPYGTWYYVSGYGYCWRPTVAVVQVGWRPYCHGGRWIYTTYGWYWQSDYTWGWAPFHYGRWYMHASYGWLWVPDTVWGPSWVTWRYADGYCGWAPLPPGVHYSVGVGFTYHGSRVSVGFGFGLGHAHYTFVSARHFTSPHIHQYVASQQQAQTIYNNTTIINNYIHGDNNTIINRGIAREEIVRHTRADIPTLAVRDLPAGEGAALRPDRVAREGNQSVVYRQTLPQATLASDKGEAAQQVKAPAPAVAVLNRDQRAANVAHLAGGGSASVPPAGEVPSGRVRTGPAPVAAPTTGTAPAPGTETKSPAVRPPADSAPSSEVLVSPRGRGARSTGTITTPESGGTPSETVVRTRPTPAERGTPSGNSYTPPRRDLSPSAPTAPVAPSAPSAPSAVPAKPSVPSYTPPSPSYTPPIRRETPSAPSAPSTPSYAPPSRRETAPTPSTPSYTPPPARSEPAAPAAPSYTPPTRPATPSPPSYTPPQPRRETPTASTPSYAPPGRSDNRSALAPSAPLAQTTPSYTPPAPSYSPPTRSVAPAAPTAPPAPTYTPPTRAEVRTMPPANAPSTPSYNPPARTAPSAPPSAPAYVPPSRPAAAPSAPAVPSYTPPSRGATPSYTPPSSGGSPGSEPTRRGR